MAQSLNLSASQLEEMLTFSSLGWLPDEIDGIRREWESAVIPEDLTSGLNGVSSRFNETAEEITGFLVKIRLVSLQTDNSIEEIVESLDAAVAESNWSEHSKAQWFFSKEALSALLNEPSLRRVAMVINLSYEYSHLVQSAQIIPDIRPIFNEDLDSIECAVVSHTLQLKYDSVEGDHTLSLAMDDADVRKLLDQCERALRKAEVASRTMVRCTGLPIFISGQSSARRREPNESEEP